jgi:hypothetical protein
MLVGCYFARGVHVKNERRTENPYSAPQVHETMPRPPRQRYSWRIILKQSLNNALWLVLAFSIVLIPLSCIQEINSLPSSDEDLVNFVMRGMTGLALSLILGAAVGILGTFLLALLNDELEF